jgi:hypothetical protein
MFIDSLFAIGLTVVSGYAGVKETGRRVSGCHDIDPDSPAIGQNSTWQALCHPKYRDIRLTFTTQM